MKGFLILQDGSVYEGESIGSTEDAMCEVVFNTSMTGYLEILTDPSYYGQAVTMTYPLIGNYGFIGEDKERERPACKGFIVRELCGKPSNFRCEKSLEEFLKENNITGLQGVDTRKLTKHIREFGTMMGFLTTNEQFDLEDCVRKLQSFQIKDSVQNTSVKEKYHIPSAGKKVALYDFGAKENIVRSLVKFGCDVTVFPQNTPAEEIINGGFDGVMLSNGPGDPKDNPEIIETIKKLIASGIPIFGICLGHQLIALASGCDTFKLKYGHRGGNHPVYDKKKDRAYITSQNHGYSVVPESVPQDIMEISHWNVNDNTVEGLRYKEKKIFSVQFHPEAAPGPVDSEYLFEEFLQMMN